MSDSPVVSQEQKDRAKLRMVALGGIDLRTATEVLARESERHAERLEELERHAFPERFCESHEWETVGGSPPLDGFTMTVPLVMHYWERCKKCGARREDGSTMTVRYESTFAPGEVKAPQGEAANASVELAEKSGKPGPVVSLGDDETCPECGHAGWKHGERLFRDDPRWGSCDGTRPDGGDGPCGCRRLRAPSTSQGPAGNVGDDAERGDEGYGSGPVASPSPASAEHPRELWVVFDEVERGEVDPSTGINYFLPESYRTEAAARATLVPGSDQSLAHYVLKSIADDAITEAAFKAGVEMQAVVAQQRERAERAEARVREIKAEADAMAVAVSSACTDAGMPFSDIDVVGFVRSLASERDELREKLEREKEVAIVRNRERAEWKESALTLRSRLEEAEKERDDNLKIAAEAERRLSQDDAASVPRNVADVVAEIEKFRERSDLAAVVTRTTLDLWLAALRAAPREHREQDKCKGCENVLDALPFGHFVNGFCVDCRDAGRHREQEAVAYAVMATTFGSHRLKVAGLHETEAAATQHRNRVSASFKPVVVPLYAGAAPLSEPRQEGMSEAEVVRKVSDVLIDFRSDLYSLPEWEDAIRSRLAECGVLAALTSTPAPKPQGMSREEAREWMRAHRAASKACLDNTDDNASTRLFSAFEATENRIVERLMSAPLPRLSALDELCAREHPLGDAVRMLDGVGKKGGTLVMGGGYARALRDLLASVSLPEKRSKLATPKITDTHTDKEEK